MSAVDPQVAAGHEAAGVADQEDSGAAVFLRHRELAEHVLRRPVPAALGVFLEESLYHGGGDVAGRNGVDADAEGAPFGGEVAAELENGSFGGVVGGADEALWRKTLAKNPKGPKSVLEPTRLATVPLMEAIMAILPPLPQRIISLATAWAVMKTPEFES